LKSGHFYSSTWPTLDDVVVTEGEVTVRCSPASRILVTGGVPGKEMVAGAGMTEATLPLAMFKGGYFRVTVVGEAGGRAWSNPIWQ